MKFHELSEGLNKIKKQPPTILRREYGTGGAIISRDELPLTVLFAPEPPTHSKTAQWAIDFLRDQDVTNSQSRDTYEANDSYYQLLFFKDKDLNDIKRLFNEGFGLEEGLTESPLPDDWSDIVYSTKIPFKTRVEYAAKRSELIGSGSSRVAFEIPYENRKTVLKIAKNTKGMAQNKAEIKAFSESFIQALGIIIPLIDADKNATWLHTEYARPAKQTDFHKVTGFNLKTTLKMANELSARYYRLNQTGLTIGKEEGLLKNKLIKPLVYLFSKYEDIVIDDLEQLANWGVYQGRLVIIDLGLTTDIYTKHYSKRTGNAKPKLVIESDLEEGLNKKDREPPIIFEYSLLDNGDRFNTLKNTIHGFDQCELLSNNH